MAGGTTLLKVGDKLVSERYAPYHVGGQNKFYRRQCFEDIGGLQPVYGWDILDETDARRHGWLTLSDPAITIIHHRLQGSAFGGLRGRIIWGQGAYAIGSHPLFAVARGIFRLAERPWLVGGLAFIWGFFQSYFNPEINRITDQDLIRLPAAGTALPPDPRQPPAASAERTLMSAATVNILGLPVGAYTMASLLSRLQELLAAPGCAAAYGINAYVLNLIYQHPDYLAGLRRADCLYADGASLRLAARVLGGRIPEKLTTTDLWPHLCELAVARGYRFFLLGANPGWRSGPGPGPCSSTRNCR